MNDRVGVCALGVNRAMQKRFLRRRVAAQHVSRPNRASTSRAGSSWPRQESVGVNNQPSSRRALMLPLLPAANPRSNSERPWIDDAFSQVVFANLLITTGARFVPRFQEKSQGCRSYRISARARAAALSAFRASSWSTARRDRCRGRSSVRVDAERMQHGARCFSTGDDQLPNAEIDQPRSDRCKRIFDERRRFFDTEALPVCA